MVERTILCEYWIPFEGVWIGFGDPNSRQDEERHGKDPLERAYVARTRAGARFKGRDQRTGMRPIGLRRCAAAERYSLGPGNRSFYAAG